MQQEYLEIPRFILNKQREMNLEDCGQIKPAQEKVKRPRCEYYDEEPRKITQD